MEYFRLLNRPLPLVGMTAQIDFKYLDEIKQNVKIIDLHKNKVRFSLFSLIKNILHYKAFSNEAE